MKMTHVRGRVFLGALFLGFSSLLLAKNHTLTLGSYNVENLWDGNSTNTYDAWEKYLKTHSEVRTSGFNVNPLQYLDYADEESNWYSEEIQKTKINNLIKAIELAQSPDIFAFQEIESAGNTSEVFELPYSDTETFRKKLHHMGYKHFFIGQQEENNPVSVTTAIISKVKLTELASVLISKPNSTSARDIQVVEYETHHANRVIIFNGHWKSKRGGGDEDRIATAKQIRKRIQLEKKADSSTHFVVLGDLNAEYFEEPLVELGASCQDDVATEKKIKTQTSTPSENLYNLWCELPKEERWESAYRGRKHALSHLIISESLLDNYVTDSFKVVGQHKPESNTLLDSKGEPFRWQIRKNHNYTTHLGKGYSDHLPLIATLIF